MKTKKKKKFLDQVEAQKLFFLFVFKFGIYLRTNSAHLL